jgi:inner membrane protein
MDPVTHTLVGASLASTRLGRTTRLAAPALVIGANLPDVDVFSYVRGADFALGFRRGWTHGVPAQIVLPALLALALWLWSRRWPTERRAGVSGKWLVALSYLAVLTHPALDWLNTYGMRWWMPIRDTWSYGDSLFIMDPWLWLMLGICWLLPRRPTRALGITFAVLTGLLLLVVGGRAPAYLGVVTTVVVVALTALFLKLPEEGRAARLLPTVGLSMGALYIVGMIALQAVTELEVRDRLAKQHYPAARLMVGPLPANPLRWDVLALDGEGYYRYGIFNWLDRETMALGESRLQSVSTSWLQETAGPQIGGFQTWTRFPWIEGAPVAGERIHVMDARYARQRVVGFGGAVIEPAEP